MVTKDYYIAQREYETEKYIRSTLPTLWLPLYKRDSSGTNTFLAENNGTICTVSGATWGMQGRTFNGTTDEIAGGAHASLNLLTAMTIIVWFKLDTLGALQTLVGKGYSGASPFVTYKFRVSDTNVLNYLAGDGTNQVNGSASIAANTWYQGAIVRTSATAVQPYLNAIPDGAGGTADAPGTKPTDVLYLGASSTNGAAWIQFLDGLVGELEIYSYPFSPLEIQRLYQATCWRYK